MSERGGGGGTGAVTAKPSAKEHVRNVDNFACTELNSSIFGVTTIYDELAGSNEGHHNSDSID